MEDRELAASLKAGNVGALEKLIERWRLKAEAYANGILHDPHAAQDAVQEAFSRIWALRTGLDERFGFSPYLFTIVRRICIDETRRRKRRPDLPGDLPDLPSGSAEADFIERWERLRRMELLAALDEKDRKLLLAFSLEGKPTRQIAGELGLSDVQVRVRLHRIRRKLKKGMNDDA